MKYLLFSTFAVGIMILEMSPGFAVSFGSYGVGGIVVSSWWAATDGYDGTPFDMPAWVQSGHVYMGSYHENGPSWSGPTGFYEYDIRASVPWGGSTTWDPIYLWAQDSSSVGDRLLARAVPFEGGSFPGWRLVLALDYVPESLNWIGPWQYEFLLGDITVGNPQYFTLPVPTVSNPLDGVRMHLTAYAPIPEPSSLAALGLGFVPVVWRLRRRRK